MCRRIVSSIRPSFYSVLVSRIPGLTGLPQLHLVFGSDFVFYLIASLPMTSADISFTGKTDIRLSADEMFLSRIADGVVILAFTWFNTSIQQLGWARYARNISNSSTLVNHTVVLFLWTNMQHKIIGLYWNLQSHVVLTPACMTESQWSNVKMFFLFIRILHRTGNFYSFTILIKSYLHSFSQHNVWHIWKPIVLSSIMCVNWFIDAKCGLLCVVCLSPPAFRFHRWLAHSNGWKGTVFLAST